MKNNNNNNSTKQPPEQVGGFFSNAIDLIVGRKKGYNPLKQEVDDFPQAIELKVVSGDETTKERKNATITRSKSKRKQREYDKSKLKVIKEVWDDDIYPVIKNKAEEINETVVNKLDDLTITKAYDENEKSTFQYDAHNPMQGANRNPWCCSVIYNSCRSIDAFAFPTTRSRDPRTAYESNTCYTKLLTYIYNKVDSYLEWSRRSWKEQWAINEPKFRDYAINETWKNEMLYLKDFIKDAFDINSMNNNKINNNYYFITNNNIKVVNDNKKVVNNNYITVYNIDSEALKEYKKINNDKLPKNLQFLYQSVPSDDVDNKIEEELIVKSDSLKSESLNSVDKVLISSDNDVITEDLKTKTHHIIEMPTQDSPNEFEEEKNIISVTPHSLKKDEAVKSAKTLGNKDHAIQEDLKTSSDLSHQSENDRKYEEILQSNLKVIPKVNFIKKITKAICCNEKDKQKAKINSTRQKWLDESKAQIIEKNKIKKQFEESKKKQSSDENDLSSTSSYKSLTPFSKLRDNEDKERINKYRQERLSRYRNKEQDGYIDDQIEKINNDNKIMERDIDQLGVDVDEIKNEIENKAQLEPERQNEELQSRLEVVRPEVKEETKEEIEAVKPEEEDPFKDNKYQHCSMTQLERLVDNIEISSSKSYEEPVEAESIQQDKKEEYQPVVIKESHKDSYSSEHTMASLSSDTGLIQGILDFKNPVKEKSVSKSVKSDSFGTAVKKQARKNMISGLNDYVSQLRANVENDEKKDEIQPVKTQSIEPKSTFVYEEFSPKPIDWSKAPQESTSEDSKENSEPSGLIKDEPVKSDDLSDQESSSMASFEFNPSKVECIIDNTEEYEKVAKYKKIKEKIHNDEALYNYMKDNDKDLINDVFYT